MTKKEKLAKINPKKMSPEQLKAAKKAAKTARPDAAMADRASPVQQQMEATSMVQSGPSINAKAEGLLITDSDLPVRAHFILLGIILFCLCFFIWACWATLDEVTRAQGKIIPSTETKTIQSLEGGIVEEFLVREGEQVAKGQTLLRLRDIEATSDLGTNEQRYMGTLASIARLQAQVEGLSAPDFPQEVMEKAPQSVTEELNAFKANRMQMDSQRLVLEQQLSQRRQEVREITTRISDTRGLLSIAREEKAMIAPLVEKGSAPRMELLQLDRSIKERQTELNTSLTSLPRARSAVEEAEARLAELKNNAAAEAQTELAAKTVELNSLRETLTALQDRKTRTEMISPVDGFVQDIKVNTIGGVVQPGEDVIQIVPLDENLLVEAQIRPDDIGFLHPGMKAVVKITAYDYSIYGGLEGKLLDISPDSFQDEQGNIYFRARIETFENQLKPKGNKKFPIKVGMQTSVDILTGEKTVMAYILKPLRKTLDNAMNER